MLATVLDMYETWTEAQTDQSCSISYNAEVMDCRANCRMVYRELVFKSLVSN